MDQTVIYIEVAGLVIGLTFTGFSRKALAPLESDLAKFRTSESRSYDLLLELTGAGTDDLLGEELKIQPRKEVSIRRVLGRSIIESDVLEGQMDEAGGVARIGVIDNYRFLQTAILSSIVYWSARRGILFVHGAAMIRDGRGLLISGPSASGKSTISRGLAKHKVEILGDEFCCVRVSEGVKVFPSPFNEIATGRKRSAALNAILYIDGHGDNEVARIGRIHAYSNLLRSIVSVDAAMEFRDMILDLAEEVAASMQSYTMVFDDADYARLSEMLPWGG
jgi:hypothetical protein